MEVIQPIHFCMKKNHMIANFLPEWEGRDKKGKEGRRKNIKDKEKSLPHRFYFSCKIFLLTYFLNRTLKISHREEVYTHYFILDTYRYNNWKDTNSLVVKYSCQLRKRARKFISVFVKVLELNSLQNKVERQTQSRQSREAL